jgi:hypothetical protein
VNQDRGVNIFVTKSTSGVRWGLFSNKLAQVNTQNVHLSYKSPNTLRVDKQKTTSEGESAANGKEVHHERPGYRPRKKVGYLPDM